MKRVDWEALSREGRRAYANPARPCRAEGCEEPAGTPWGPLWCADHDDERVNRIARQFREIRDDYEARLAERRERLTAAVAAGDAAALNTEGEV